MPKTITLVLDDELAARLARFAEETGFDAAGAVDHAVRSFLDGEDRARLTTEALVAAAREGHAGTIPGHALGEDEMRLWLLSWGAETERKRPRSC
ncbi:MAG: transcriptional regulator [Magnetospirillum sp.]|nr:MAG: transcriptional regulator [Magnetospirillum sp.]